MKKTGFLLAAVISLNSFGLSSASAHSGSCNSLILGVTKQQRQAIISELRDENVSRYVQIAQATHLELVDAETIFRDTLETLRAAVEREKQTAILQIDWIQKAAAKKFASRLATSVRLAQPIELNDDQRILSLPSWAPIARNGPHDTIWTSLRSESRAKRSALTSAIMYGDRLLRFNDRMRRLENEILSRFAELSVRSEALYQERLAIEDILCKVDSCINLAPSLGLVVTDFILESVDLLTGNILVSLATWQLGGTERSQQARNFFVKLRSLEKEALKAGYFDLRGEIPAKRRGKLSQLYNAWATSHGPMGGVDRQGFDVFLDLLAKAPPIGALHSAHRMAKIAAQTPQLRMAKERLERVSRELRARDKQISAKLKETVCEIVEGCDYDDEAAWTELMKAGGLAK